MIVNQDGKWYVKSEKGKNLGGPYSSRNQAVHRLKQVEYFKHKGAEFIDKLAHLSDSLTATQTDSLGRAWK